MSDCKTQWLYFCQNDVMYFSQKGWIKKKSCNILQIWQEISYVHSWREAIFLIGATAQADLNLLNGSLFISTLRHPFPASYSTLS